MKGDFVMPRMHGGEGFGRPKPFDDGIPKPKNLKEVPGYVSKLVPGYQSLR